MTRPRSAIASFDELAHDGRVTTPRSRRACPTGKRRFQAGLAALTALADIGMSEQSPGEEHRAYRCTDCRGWHLTSKGLYESPRMPPWQPSRKRKYSPP